MPTITTQQARALEALDWLLDEDPGNHGTGRTFILAAAYLRKAVRVGGWIQVTDPTDGWLMRAIREQAQAVGCGIQTGGPNHFMVPGGISAEVRQRILEGYTEDPGLAEDITRTRAMYREETLREVAAQNRDRLFGGGPFTSYTPPNVAQAIPDVRALLQQGDYLDGIGMAVPRPTGLSETSGAWLSRLCWTCHKSPEQCRADGKCLRVRIPGKPKIAEPTVPVTSAWERLLDDEGT